MFNKVYDPMKQAFALVLTFFWMVSCSEAMPSAMNPASDGQDTLQATPDSTSLVLIHTPPSVPSITLSMNPYSPKAGDTSLQRGLAFIESAEVATLPGSPNQVFLKLKGNLPSPCHALRVSVPAPDAQSRINVDVYSLADPNLVCAQNLVPFATEIELGSFAAGHYEVWINARKIGEFDA